LRLDARQDLEGADALRDFVVVRGCVGAHGRSTGSGNPNGGGKRIPLRSNVPGCPGVSTLPHENPVPTATTAAPPVTAARPRKRRLLSEFMRLPVRMRAKPT
jgi:hypothetical protein